MQATILRETGWTVVEYRDQPAGDIFDLHAHLNEHPPAYRILDWIHLDRSKMPQSAHKPRARPAIEATSEQEMHEMMQALGANAQPMPEAMRAQLLWAREQCERMVTQP